MANTVTKGKWIVEVLFDGATALDMADHYTAGLCIESLEFKPAADAAAIIVRESSATGPRLFSVASELVTDSKVKYFNTEQSKKAFLLYVVGAEVTALSRLIITLK